MSHLSDEDGEEVRSALAKISNVLKKYEKESEPFDDVDYIQSAVRWILDVRSVRKADLDYVQSKFRKVHMSSMTIIEPFFFPALERYRKEWMFYTPILLSYDCNPDGTPQWIDAFARPLDLLSEEEADLIQGEEEEARAFVCMYVPGLGLLPLMSDDSVMAAAELADGFNMTIYGSKQTPGAKSCKFEMLSDRKPIPHA